jgi:flavin reductase (DIM6/NTAB) family NADH-FMN oxidoreductase RutF
MSQNDPTSAKIIDAKTFWQAIGARAIGATVVTASGADGPAGFLGLSATHVCADPPTMLVSIDTRTSALAAVRHARHFAINFLGKEAQGVADMFSGRTAIKGAERFGAGQWGTLTTGAPTFNDAIGVIDCTLEKTVDHFATTIAIGRVVDLRVRSSGDPLIYFRGRYLND